MVFGGFSIRILSNGVQVLQCDRLSACPSCRHGFTTRIGGCSQGPYAALNMGFHLGDTFDAVARNYRLVTQGLGLPEKIATTHQVHGDDILTVTADDLRMPGEPAPTCDGLLTATPGVTLCGRTADCVPLLFYCPEPRMCVFAHAGWRGTAQNIAGKAIQKMIAAGAEPACITAAVGPSIGPCCFRVHRDVADVFAAMPAHLTRDCMVPLDDGRFSVHLQKINALQMAEQGVTDISVCTDCTCCDETRWFSHRRTGLPRGSMAAFIAFDTAENR